MLWCLLLRIPSNSSSCYSRIFPINEKKGKEEMILEFAKAYFCTWIIETPVLLFFLKSRFKPKAILLISTLLNICTLPFVWFFFPLLIRNYTLYLIVAEAFAYITEALLLLLITKDLQLAIKTAIIANTTSLLFGLVLFPNFNL